MTQILKIVPIIFYLIVGIISLIMAKKNLFSTKFLPFQNKIYGDLWENIDIRLQKIILMLIKIAGLSFLTNAILLIFFPITNYFFPDPFIKYAIPIVSLIFCFGLFLVNFELHKKTGSNTPWKGSLYAMFLIIIGLMISIL